MAIYKLSTGEYDDYRTLAIVSRELPITKEELAAAITWVSKEEDAAYAKLHKMLAEEYGEQTEKWVNESTKINKQAMLAAKLGAELVDHTEVWVEEEL